MTAGLASAFLTQLGRDLRLAMRRWGELANPLVFFLVVAALFPLALSPTPDTLSRLAPGVVWVGALLASLLAQGTVFRTDYDDGSLEQMVLSPQPLSLLVLAKITAHWLLTGVPLVIVAPLVGQSLYLDPAATPTLVAALLLGTPTLSLLGGIGAALTLAVNRGGLLLSILVLPLAVPVLVFGARATDLAVHGDNPAGALYLLAAIFALTATLAPFAAAAAVRISLD